MPAPREAWYFRHEKLIANAFAFVMTFLLLLFIVNATAGEVAPPTFTERVLVLHRNPLTQEWVTKIGKVESIPNFKPLACFKMPEKRIVSCIYMTNEGATMQHDTKLIGEETT